MLCERGRGFAQLWWSARSNNWKYFSHCLTAWSRVDRLKCIVLQGDSARSVGGWPWIFPAIGLGQHIEISSTRIPGFLVMRPHTLYGTFKPAPTALDKSQRTLKVLMRHVFFLRNREDLVLHSRIQTSTIFAVWWTSLTMTSDGVSVFIDTLISTYEHGTFSIGWI